MHSHGWVYLAPMVSDDDDNGFRYPFMLGPRMPVTMRVVAKAHGISIGADRPLSPTQRKELRAVWRSLHTWVLCTKYRLGVGLG